MSLAAVVTSYSAKPGLDVSVSSEGAVTVIAFRGDADIATMPIVAEAMTRVLADQKGDVVLDLAHTEFIGPAALRAVLKAKDALDLGGRHLTIRSPSRIAARVLGLLGLSDLVGPASKGNG